MFIDHRSSTKQRKIVSASPPVTNGGHGDFKLLNNGGLKKICILIDRQGIMVGVDLKIGGNPFQSNFGATKDT